MSNSNLKLLVSLEQALSTDVHFKMQLKERCSDAFAKWSVQQATDFASLEKNETGIQIRIAGTYHLALSLNTQNPNGAGQVRRNNQNIFGYQNWPDGYLGSLSHTTDLAAGDVLELFVSSGDLCAADAWCGSGWSITLLKPF